MTEVKAKPASLLDVTALIKGTKNVDPRPYQARIINKAYTAYLPVEHGGKGLRAVLIQSPTGSGKTIMALLEIRALQRWYKSQGRKLVVGWVAMRRNLLEQASKENEAKKVGAEVHWISMFQKELPDELLNAEDRMLVIDEAQHDAASSCMHIHAEVKPQLILGMTATPFRTDSVKLCFDTVIADAGISNLIKDGFLAQFDHYTIPCWTPTAVARFYLREPSRWGKSIMYFHTVDACFETKRLMELGGIRCDVVTGSSDKEAQLEAYRNGATDVLINCYVLAEGFDCPELQSVFCRPSCKGVTIQMCGRAFRKCMELEARGIRKVIVQSKHSHWPFIKTAQPVIQWLWTPENGDMNGKDVTPEQSEAMCESGEWRSLTVNPNINRINTRMLVALAGINVTMPKFISSRQGKTRRRRGGGGPAAAAD